MNESCHTYEWVMSHIWMSHVTHMNESCHTYEWGMSHTWMHQVPHMNESCHTYEWVMSHIWMSHVTHMDASSPTSCTLVCTKSNIWMCHINFWASLCVFQVYVYFFWYFTCISRHTYERVMSHFRCMFEEGGWGGTHVFRALSSVCRRQFSARV